MTKREWEQQENIMLQKTWLSDTKRKFLQGRLTWDLQEISDHERDLGVKGSK